MAQKLVLTPRQKSRWFYRDRNQYLNYQYYVLHIIAGRFCLILRRFKRQLWNYPGTCREGGRASPTHLPLKYPYTRHPSPPFWWNHQSPGARFTKVPKRFSYRESHSKILNVTTTELFDSNILRQYEQSFPSHRKFQAYTLLRF